MNFENHRNASIRKCTRGIKGIILFLYLYPINQLSTQLRYLLIDAASSQGYSSTYKCGTFTLDGSSVFLVVGPLDFLIDFEVRRSCAHMRKSKNSKLHVISEPCVTIDINIDDMYSIDISTWYSISIVVHIATTWSAQHGMAVGAQEPMCEQLIFYRYNLLWCFNQIDYPYSVEGTCLISSDWSRSNFSVGSWTKINQTFLLDYRY